MDVEEDGDKEEEYIGQDISLAEAEWEEEDDDEEGADDFEEGRGWEPLLRSKPQDEDQRNTEINEDDAHISAEDIAEGARVCEARRQAHAHLHAKTFPILFGGQVGKAIQSGSSSVGL